MIDRKVPNEDKTVKKESAKTNTNEYKALVRGLFLYNIKKKKNRNKKLNEHGGMIWIDKRRCR